MELDHLSEDVEVSEGSFQSSSSESELSAFKTRFGLPSIQEENSTLIENTSAQSSLGETRSSLAPLARSNSLEDVYNLFEEDERGEMVINGSYNDKPYTYDSDDVNSIFSDDFQAQILNIVGSEQQELEGGRFRDDHSAGLKEGSLQDFEKLSSKNKVMEWLGPGTIYYNDHPYAMEQMNVAIGNGSIVDDNIKQAQEAAARNQDDDSIDEPLPMTRSDAAILVQKSFRGSSSRKSLRNRSRAIIQIQRILRGFQQRTSLKKEVESAIILQKTFRMHSSKRHVHRIRNSVLEASTLIAGDIISLALRKVSHESMIVALRNEKEKQISAKNFIRKKAAISIQKVVRSFLAKKVYAKRKISAMTNTTNESALKIQCLFRAFRDRKKASLQRRLHYQKQMKEKKRIMKVRRVVKAIIIQKYIRRLLVKSGPIMRIKKAEQRAFRKKIRDKLMKNSALLIQRNYRGWQVRAYRNKSGRRLMRRRNRRRKKRRQARLALENRSAIVIQSLHRGRITRNINIIDDLRQIRNEKAAIKIQSALRGKAIRKKRLIHVFRLYRNAATVIQSLHRGNSIRKGEMLRSLKADRLKRRKNSAAIVIQSEHRKHAAKNKVIIRKRSIVVLQTWLRMSYTERLYKTRRSAVIRIQNFRRKILAIARFFHLRKLRDAEIARRQERIRLLAQQIFVRKVFDEKFRKAQRKLAEKAIQNLHNGASVPKNRRKRIRQNNEMRDPSAFPPVVTNRKSLGYSKSPSKGCIEPPLLTQRSIKSQNENVDSFEPSSPSETFHQSDVEFYKTKSPSPRTRRLYRIHTSNYDIRD